MTIMPQKAEKETKKTYYKSKNKYTAYRTRQKQYFTCDTKFEDKRLKLIKILKISVFLIMKLEI